MILNRGNSVLGEKQGYLRTCKQVKSGQKIRVGGQVTEGDKVLYLQEGQVEESEFYSKQWEVLKGFKEESKK